MKTDNIGQGIVGPSVAKAHILLASALEKAKESIGPERLERIEKPLRRQLDDLISRLQHRGDDWEDEWPA